MKKLTIIGILIAGILACAVFQTSDLEGTWYMYMFETNTLDGSSYHAHGSFTVDESGNITGGTYIPPDGASINATGGTLSLNPGGILSGSLDAEGGITVNFTSGKLDEDKNILAYVAGVSIGPMDLAMDFGVAIKGGGSFSTSDLEGTWHMYMFETNPDFGSYHAHGSFTVDESGKVTQGTYIPPVGESIPVADGKVSLDSGGILSGSLDAEGGITVNFTSGKLDEDKNILTYATDVTKEGMDFAKDLGVAIKGGGSFSTSDLEGTWHVYLMETNPDVGSYWLYGRFTIDDSGNVTGGTYNAPGGITVDVIDGSVSLDSSGVMSGWVKAEGGLEGTFPSGKMGADKNIITFIGNDTSGSMDLGVGVKAGLPQPGEDT